jgi:O-antigen/teichoic acid export membrane protein
MTVNAPLRVVRHPQWTVEPSGAPVSPAVSAAGASQGRSQAVVRNASALMISTIASSAIGFLFWVVAARWFPASTVGQGSAMVSSMTFLAAIAQLNLASLYARFVPTAGGRTLPLVLSGAGAAALMAILATVGYLVLVPGGAVVGPGWWAGLFFGTAVVASALTFISDGALTALGRATWVPVKNVATSAGKLALVCALGIAGLTAQGIGLLAAWTVPVVVSILVIGYLIVRKLAPAHAEATASLQTPLHRGEVARFVTAEYVNSLVSNTVAFVPPVLVALVLGATQGAYFYIPWLVGVAGTTLLWNVVTSFVVAASSHDGASHHHLTHSIRLGALVSGAGAVILIAFADPLLGLLGAGYAEHGATSLRLIGAALPCTAVILLFAAFTLMDKRVWGLTAIQLTGLVLFFVGSWLSLPRLGITGPALAYLVSQAFLAVVLLPRVIRRYRRSGRVA